MISLHFLINTSATKTISQNMFTRKLTHIASQVVPKTTAIKVMLKPTTSKNPAYEVKLKLPKDELDAICCLLPYCRYNLFNCGRWRKDEKIAFKQLVEELNIPVDKITNKHIRQIAYKLGVRDFNQCKYFFNYYYLP